MIGRKYKRILPNQEWLLTVTPMLMGQKCNCFIKIFPDFIGFFLEARQGGAIVRHKLTLSSLTLLTHPAACEMNATLSRQERSYCRKVCRKASGHFASRCGDKLGGRAIGWHFLCYHRTVEADVPFGCLYLPSDRFPSFDRFAIPSPSLRVVVWREAHVWINRFGIAVPGPAHDRRCH